MSKKFIFYGMGGHALTILELFESTTVIGYFSDQNEKSDIEWLGPYNPFKFPEAEVIVAIGNNMRRKSILNTLAHTAAVVIAHTAVVAKNVSIKEGVVILSGAIIQPNVVVERGAIINARCLVDHDTHIGEYVHISAGAIVGSRSKIGNHVVIGVGAVVPPGSNLADNTVLRPGETFNQ